MNEVIRSIQNRRSIRKYQPRQVEKDKLDIILEAAKYAPSGHNEQPWHFLVIRNRTVIDDLEVRVREAMAECGIARVEKLGRSSEYRVFFDAPTVVIVSGDENNHDPQNHLVPFADCCAAIENMLLAAHSLDIGSCWVGFVWYLFRYPERMKDIPIPAGFRPYYAVCLGYADPAFVHECHERKTGVVDYLK